jgi:hypothetical protein
MIEVLVEWWNTEVMYMTWQWFALGGVIAIVGIWFQEREWKPVKAKA